MPTFSPLVCHLTWLEASYDAAVPPEGVVFKASTRHNELIDLHK